MYICICAAFVVSPWLLLFGFAFYQFAISIRSDAFISHFDGIEKNHLLIYMRMSDGFLSENLNFIDFIEKAQNNKRAQILCLLRHHIMTNPSIYSLIL